MPVLENLRLATPYSILWTQLLQSDPIDGHLKPENAETVKEKLYKMRIVGKRQICYTESVEFDGRRTK